MLKYLGLRKIFGEFWQSKGHQEVPPAPLVLKEDPTTLFTSSGMQQLVPCLMGEPHPLGKKLYNIQPSLRTQDIMEVGDNRHTTFFEMIGNWSMGDYFKNQEFPWVLELFTKHLGLPKDRLYVTVFEGENGVPKDEESTRIWQELGIPKERIFYYGFDKNWWSRSGTPDKMPAGEIGGPDSEIFYDFGAPHDKKYGPACHPNCECGRFLEIGNSVFIQYKKKEDGTLEELAQKNVDFGGGVERILAASANNPDVFASELFTEIISMIEKVSGQKYENNRQAVQIIADHLKAATFLIINGVTPSNKEHGYVLRRFLRRSVVKMRKLKGGMPSPDNFVDICQSVLKTYENVYFNLENDIKVIEPVVKNEILRFEKSLENGLREIEKIAKINGKIAFDLYQTYGFPLEITEELFREKGQPIKKEEFYQEFKKHQELSRAASVGMFKGGLVDQGGQTIKYHTATHIIHQALFNVLGTEVRQEGSNITGERLRFDFYSPVKPAPEEIKKVEEIVNDVINQSLPVSSKTMTREEALKIGAKAFFRQKYPYLVKVYFIGEPANPFSKELCGGPHVASTKEIGRIEIYKLEKIGSSLYRLYAK
jgi:alanyl-tRNA synthetase